MSKYPITHVSIVYSLLGDHIIIFRAGKPKNAWKAYSFTRKHHDMIIDMIGKNKPEKSASIGKYATEFMFDFTKSPAIAKH